MSKKVQPQDKVLDFFLTAPMTEAVGAFNAIKRIMFNRQLAGGQQQPAAATTQPKQKRTRTKRTAAPKPTAQTTTQPVSITEAAE